METETGLCFPINFVVSVTLKMFCCMQMDSKSKKAKYRKGSANSCFQFQESPACLTEVRGFDNRFTDRHSSLVHFM